MSAPTTKNPAKVCQVEDIFAVDGQPPAEVIGALTTYLAAFAAPVRRDGKTYCISCDMPMDAMMQMLGLGVAYTWGLAHGEAACSGCGWPARGMHYVRDADGQEVATLRNFFLAYHPDQVERKGRGT